MYQKFFFEKTIETLKNDTLKSKLHQGRAVPTTNDLVSEKSSMVHEQLARIRFAMEQLDFNNKNILDIGCGTGYTSQYVRERCLPRMIHGFDSSQECISFAQEHYPDNTYSIHDATGFELHRKFDIIIASEVIEHILNYESLLEKARAHLEDNGVFVLSTPNRDLFSLGREKSILNETHIKEFNFFELQEVLSKFFAEIRFFGMYHKSAIMQDAFQNYVRRIERIKILEKRASSFTNLLPTIFKKCIKKVIFLPDNLHKRFDMKSTNVYKRTMDDFIFDKDNLNKAIWFIAFCSKS